VGDSGQGSHAGAIDVGSAPPAPSPQDLTESLREWTTGAEALDHFDLALRLVEYAVHDGGSDAPTALTRARLLLCLGRPHDAVQALEEAGILELPDRAPLTAETLTVAAVRAAAGDEQLYRRVLSATQLDQWLPAYLVGAAAELRGDVAVSEQAWTAAVELGALTSHTFPRWAAAAVSRRSQRSPKEAIGTIVAVARAAGRLPHDLALAPQPVLAAAELLRARGDVAGARLLTMAVDRLNPPVPAIRQRLAVLTPSMRGYRWTGRLLLALAILLVPLGYLGLGLLFVGGRLWDTFVRVPGLDRTDSRVWRGLAAARFDNRSARVEIARGNAGALTVLAAFSSMGVGVFASMLMLDALARLFPSGSPDAGTTPGASLPMTLQVFIWLVGLISCPVVTVLLIDAARRRFRQWRLRSTRRHARAQLRTDASRCHCLQVSRLTDEQALLYAENHLRPGSQTVAVEERLRRTPRDVITVSACPGTGMLWLGTDLVADRPAVLLRGTAPHNRPERPDDAPGMYL
jgi:hypothetical protein